MLFITLSRVIDAITLFLQILLYSSSFVGTPKKEIREAALEQRQLKIEQFSSGIVRFSTRHEDNSFTLNCSMFPPLFCLYFMQARIDWVLRIFGTFRFLWLWSQCKGVLKTLSSVYLIFFFPQKSSSWTSDRVLNRPLKRRGAFLKKAFKWIINLWIKGLNLLVNADTNIWLKFWLKFD